MGDDYPFLMFRKNNSGTVEFIDKVTPELARNVNEGRDIYWPRSICKRVGECTDEEINAVLPFLVYRDSTNIESCFLFGDWTDEELRNIVDRSGKIKEMFFGARYRFTNGNIKTAEENHQYIEILRSIQKSPMMKISFDGFFGKRDRKDYYEELKRLGIKDAKAIWENCEMTFFFPEDIVVL